MRNSSLLASTGLLRRALRIVPERAVEAGLAPARLGYRWVAREGVAEYFARRAAHPDGRSSGTYETLAPAFHACNALPENVASLDELSAERGWWGFSFHDVPRRKSCETFRATLPNCRLAWHRDANNEFRVAILNQDQRSLELREISFRPSHADALRRAPSQRRVPRATWILERVWHNYSHWLTAHLPKLCLLRARGELGDVVLPRRRPAFVDASLRKLGIDPEQHSLCEPEGTLDVDELTLLGTDRFRPDLLQPVRRALALTPTKRPERRIYVTRRRCDRRRLLNEGDVWPLLRATGYERVEMETLSFDEQVRLMSETATLIAPHGAGLTNMLFAAPGTRVVELADPAFPNPNFYALAAALGQRYWLVPAASMGTAHPLERDLVVDARDIRLVLDQLEGVAR